MTVPRHLVMGVEESHEYVEWRDRRTPYRDGSSIHRAFLDGYRGLPLKYRDGSTQHQAYLAGQAARRRVDNAPKIHVQCSDCAWDGEHRVIADRGWEIEGRCPECGGSTHERVDD